MFKKHSYTVIVTFTLISIYISVIQLNKMVYSVRKTIQIIFKI
jgi:hypothetical protein